jgi:hypothetical protein
MTADRYRSAGRRFGEDGKDDREPARLANNATPPLRQTTGPFC